VGGQNSSGLSSAAVMLGRPPRWLCDQCVMFVGHCQRAWQATM